MTQRDATGRSDRSPSDTAGASVTVRRAEPKDAPLVAAMVREIAEHEGQSEDVHVDDRDWSELLARPDVTVLLAEDGGHVAGYVSAVRQLHLWDGGDVLALDDLFVRPGHRDAGIGRRLMQELADVASREQLHIRWGVEPDNADAQRFYRRLGATLRPEGRGDLATRGDQREPRGIGAAAVSSSQRTRNRTAGPAAAAAPVGRSARRARPDERPAVRAVLPSAFQDDPLYRWLYPDAGVRAAQLRPLFDLLLDAAFVRDAVWVLDDLSAAAVHAHHPTEVISADVVDRYVEHLSTTIGPSRTLAATDAMAACAAFSPSAPHEVLHSIAVPLHARGSGAGSAMLRHLLDGCDQRGGSLYLESSNLRNISLYRRHGFRPLGTVPLPGGEDRMTPMLRPSP